MLDSYQAHRRDVDAELRAVFEDREGFLYDVLRYHMGWVDERGAPEDGPAPLHFQGLLSLMCSEALSGTYQSALPAAAAVELVHNFTLVHGDVQANRASGGDRPSIWWIWGPAQAINAGDGLHALGRTTIMRLAQRGVPPDRILTAMQSLDRACLTVCEGQYMDLEFQDQLSVTNQAYLDMVSRKAGSLAACAAELGALAAGADPKVCRAFAGMGNQLGMAWQIRQDVLELWGERGDGMTTANVLNKKKSLALIYALESAPVPEKRELTSIYMKRVLQPEDVTRMVQILDSVDARTYALSKSGELVDEALSSLAGAGLTEEQAAPLKQFSQRALEG